MTAEEKSEEYVKKNYCEARSGCNSYQLYECDEGVCIRCQEFEDKKQYYLEGFYEGKQEMNAVIAKKNKETEENKKQQGFQELLDEKIRLERDNTILKEAVISRQKDIRTKEDRLTRLENEASEYVVKIENLENDLHEAKEIIRKCLDYEKENLYWIADGSDKKEYHKFREYVEKFCDMEPLFYRWVKTGDMCPEQYDIYKGFGKIAYVRFREGVISVYCPDASGEEVYKKVLTDKYPLGNVYKREIEKFLMGLYEDWYSSM